MLNSRAVRDSGPPHFILNTQKGFLSVIEPPTSAVINILEDPSFERYSDHYVDASGLGTTTLARDLTDSYDGAASLKVTPSTNTTTGMAREGLPLIADDYFISGAFKGTAGNSYRAQITTSANVEIASTVITATGQWQRFSFTYKEVTGPAVTRKFRIVKNTSANVNPFWVDMLLMKRGAESIEFFDGRLRGNTPDDQGAEWMGSQFNSPTRLSSRTKVRGYIRNLQDYGLNITGASGLGMPPMTLASQPLGSLDGSVFNNTVFDSRSFTITGLIVGRSLTETLSIKNRLMKLLAPVNGQVRQPIRLIWQFAEGTRLIGRPVEIIATYVGGLEGRLDTLRDERVAIQFQMHDPFFRSIKDSRAQLTPFTSFASQNGLIGLIDGEWQSFSGGTNVGGVVWDTFLARDGYLYAGGLFTTIGGVAASNIARMNLATKVWTQVGAAGVSAVVYDISENVYGHVVIGGNFLNAGGDANADRLAKLDPTTQEWVAFFAGVPGPDDAVTDMVLAPDGNFYIIGDFVLINGVTFNSIARATTVAWFTVGVNPGFVLTFGSMILSEIEIGPDGRPYITGYFEKPLPLTSVTNLAVYDLDLNEIHEVTDANPLNFDGPAANPERGSLRTDKRGFLWMSVPGGTLEFAAVVEYLAKWNVFDWESADPNFFLNYTEPIGIDGDGNVYVSRPHLYRADGLTWLKLDLDFSGNYTPRTLEFSPTGDIMLGGDLSGIATVGALNTVTHRGTAIAYPSFHLRGPGELINIINLDTKQSIVFAEDLIISVNETVLLETGPGHLYISSQQRGDMSRYLVPSYDGSGFGLLPGVNHIRIFFNTDVALGGECVMYWKDTYLSIDAGALAAP